MTNETYQEIKRISGDELRELLCELENAFDLGTANINDDKFLTLVVNN